MVTPVDPLLLRFTQPAKPSSGGQGSGPAERPQTARPKNGGDVVAPSLLEQIGGSEVAFDPFALAEQAGQALARSGLSIGNARPETVAALQR
ncbi:MAG: hypothetical protein HYR63_23340 [Proteobacteria bacterium]|nr:hypothetical protein [Pseudomonadota bacterium]MBI3497163.1 hypothetical protein [Pseudomonadota bacterium]